MSKSNLLDTSTQTFQDLVGNGKSYKVPTYQRDYSWAEEQWEDLWQDVLELKDDAEARHYMGAVVVKAISDRQFLIIDGQQRLATLTILCLVVINRLQRLVENGSPTANVERATALRSRFIGEKDPASLTEVSKLILNEHDNGFFQDYLVQLKMPFNPRSLSKSNRLLHGCFRYFDSSVGKLIDSSDGRKLAELISEVVARRLLFILIKVDDEISAYTVFETLNARGLELTTTDLPKNYLFSKLRAQHDLEAVQRRWNRLITTVRQEHFGEFLRFHYLTQYRKIRSGRLFKMVRTEVQTSEDVLKLLTVLEGRSELFDAIGDPSHSLWIENKDAQKYVAELKLFRVRQMIPLLFAAYEKLSPQEFVRVLKLVSTISFRYTVISGLNPSELEQVYSEGAQAILSDEAKTPREISDRLKAIYVSDDKFVADFKELSVSTSGSRGKVTKYILCRLEEELSSKACDPETDPGSIEHILPENPTHEWSDSIDQGEWDELVYRLGNLTLLKRSKNSRIGNSLYLDKKSAYEESEYALSRRIPEIAPEDWTKALIIARQREMAESAKQLWRSDFA